VSSVRRWFLVTCALLLAACGGGGSGSGGGDPGADGAATRGVLIRWRASPEAAGYVVHWGTESGVYVNALDVGEPVADADGVASFMLENVGASGVIYFALTSYDAAFEMSTFSNELSAVVP